MRSSFVIVLSACIAATAVSAAAEFSPELFPGLAGKSEAEIRLAGVAALNPGRLVKGEPKAPKTVVPESRKTRYAGLPRGGAYLRVYTLDTESVLDRVGRSALVVDCRYLATAPTDTDACAAFAAALAGSPATVSVKGDYPPVSPLPEIKPAPAGTKKFPVLVLVNAETSGPLEAMLASLQSAGKIHLVGGRTAGRTATYAAFAGGAGWWAVSGEILPAPGVSLVGLGAEPKFPVKVAPEDEFLGWQLVERGSPLSAVLLHDALGKTESAAPAKNGDVKKGGETPAAKSSDLPRTAVDPALQRAQDVIAALQVLGERN